MAGPADEQFRNLLRAKFPRLAEETGDFASEGIIDLDHTYWVGLRSVLHSLRPDATNELLGSLTIWGDVFAWFANDGPIAAVPPLLDPATLTSANVRLRTLTPADFGPLYEAATAPSSGARWRFRGKTPSPEMFQATLFDNVLAQFVVAGRNRSDCIGLVVAYNPDLACGHAAFGFYRVNCPSAPRGAMMEGAGLFIQYCFDSWPLRKIFIELPSYNGFLIETLVRLGVVKHEGKLCDYYFHNGKYCDLEHYSIARTTWQERLGPWFNA